MEKKMRQTQAMYWYCVEQPARVSSMTTSTTSTQSMATRKEVASAMAPQISRPKPFSREAAPVMFVRALSLMPGTSSRPKVFWEAVMVSTTWALSTTQAIRNQKSLRTTISDVVYSRCTCAIIGADGSASASSSARGSCAGGSKSSSTPRACMQAKTRACRRSAAGTWSRTSRLTTEFCQSKYRSPPSSRLGRTSSGLIKCCCTLLKRQAPVPKPATTRPEAMPFWSGSHFMRQSMGVM
mmetsp:Transcript_78262/g.253492  ORF Transcript_78262/g.253492 Transcript_78262/m.253492 type:complete len:239 (+) Transcript_78262:284-1000(+)